MLRRLRQLFQTLRAERKELGWRGLLRKRGWGFLILILVLYLIRDLVLYLLIPLAIAAGLAH